MFHYHQIIKILILYVFITVVIIIYRRTKTRKSKCSVLIERKLEGKPKYYSTTSHFLFDRDSIDCFGCDNCFSVSKTRVGTYRTALRRQRRQRRTIISKLKRLTSGIKRVLYARGGKQSTPARVGERFRGGVENTFEILKIDGEKTGVAC